MKRSFPREWESLAYMDPRRILEGLRDIAATYPLEELPYQVAALRTRELRGFGEGRQAALFAFGVGQATGREVSFALFEAADFDAVLRYSTEHGANYVPVQLKEWVPDFVNPHASLQAELDKLRKYNDSQDLAVAFHLNRDVTIQLSSLRLPRNIAELWFYGAVEPSQSRWGIMGNLLSREKATFHEFLYPTAA